MSGPRTPVASASVVSALVASETDDLRGAAARAMLAQDARWVGDAWLSGREVSGWLSVMFMGHGARIVYEGSLALRSADPAVGVPNIANELTARHGEVVGRSRHAGKLLDDTKKSFEDLEQELAGFYVAHHAEFTGSLRWFVRWLKVNDLGICRDPNGLILFSTIAGQFRLGLPSEVRLDEAGPIMFEVARELGQALSLLVHADGQALEVEASVDYGPVGNLIDDDRRAVEYLEERYDPAFTFETKLLLLMVEGEIGMTHVVLPATEAGHEEAVFRARIVSTYHAVRAVDELLGRHPDAWSKGARAARDLLSDADVRGWLGSPGIRQVRNRCMHYEIRDKALVLDPSAPMFGIVEALNPGLSFEDVDRQTGEIARRLVEVLHGW
jgi:hypothetical protein